MIEQPRMFYRYRAFDWQALDSICRDTLYFAHPGTFNDPLDTKPTLECDSGVEQLRTLLAKLISGRDSADVTETLRLLRLPRGQANRFAARHAERKACNTLAEIAYHSTNPEYSEGPERAEIWLLTQAIEQELLQHYEKGVCCFSASYKSPLLWSHYGDQHRGFCAGYTADRNPKPRLLRVVYGGPRAIRTSLLVRAFVHEDGRAKQKLDRSVLLRKAKQWSYEREWRLIGTQGEQESPLLLREIVFGLRCPGSVRHAVAQSLSARTAPVRFYEINEIHNRYSLRRSLLDTDELARQLPKTAISGIEMFGPFGIGTEATKRKGRTT